MTWRPDQPFNELPLLPPATTLETVAVLKACIPARAALAELRQAGQQLPNPALLINLLPMLEARDSSEIENIVTTTDRLFRYAEHDSNADPATKEALKYRTALNRGYQQLASRLLCVNTAVEICSTIKGVNMEVRRIPGTALANNKTGKVIYTPPAGEQTIRQLLSNWESYLHAQDNTDPLVKMAAAHYQFEAIHPFTDGNGRTGRILNILYLIEQDLLTLPTLYLSQYILAKRDDYYGRLLAVTRDGDWEGWLLYVMSAVYETARWTTAKISAIHHLMEETSRHIRAALPKVYSHELIQVLFEQPYCRIANLVDRDIAQRQTASRYLQQLCEIGILREVEAGREKLFVQTRLVELMAIR